MPSQDQADAEPTVAAGTTPAKRRPYSAPFVKRLDFTDTAGKEFAAPGESTFVGPS